MAIERIDYIYTFIGAMGIYLAHSIENARTDKPSNKRSFEHMSSIAFYWTLGALAYFYLIRR